MSTPKRAAGRAKAPTEHHPAQTAKPPPDLVVRGLTAEDIAALERETERRRALLPDGANLPRNAVAVAIIREALGTSKGGAP